MNAVDLRLKQKKLHWLANARRNTTYIVLNTNHEVLVISIYFMSLWKSEFQLKYEISWILILMIISYSELVRSNDHHKPYNICFLTRNWLDQMTTTNRIISSQALIVIWSKRNKFIIRNQNKRKSSLNLVAKL